jgi:hypothetical protein
LSAWLGLLALGSGCGGTQFTEVEGVVQYKGQALPNIRVVFNPEVEGPRSEATSDASGKFKLVTTDNTLGAVVGWHKVTLEDTEIWGGKFLGRAIENEGEPGGPQSRPSRIPTRYADLGQTPLRVEVKAGTQPLTLEVVDQ